jgi:hypothetical protein
VFFLTLLVTGDKRLEHVRKRAQILQISATMRLRTVFPRAALRSTKFCELDFQIGDLLFDEVRFSCDRIPAKVFDKTEYKTVEAPLRAGMITRKNFVRVEATKMAEFTLKTRNREGTAVGAITAELDTSKLRSRHIDNQMMMRYSPQERINFHPATDDPERFKKECMMPSLCV